MNYIIVGLLSSGVTLLLSIIISTIRKRKNKNSIIREKYNYKYDPKIAKEKEKEIAVIIKLIDSDSNFKYNLAKELACHQRAIVFFISNLGLLHPYDGIKIFSNWKKY